MIGIFLAFFGSSLIAIAVFIVGAIITTAILLIVFYSLILSSNVKRWVSWLILSVSIVIGLIVGGLLTRIPKVYAALVAACAGFLIGVLLNEAVLYLVGSKVLFWSVNIFLAVVCSFLALGWADASIILSTSLIGSYLAARGISLFAGGFPNEFTLLAQIKSGGVNKVSNWFYAYLAGIVIFTVFSSLIQLSRLQRLNAR